MKIKVKIEDNFSFIVKYLDTSPFQLGVLEKKLVGKKVIINDFEFAIAEDDNHWMSSDINTGAYLVDYAKNEKAAIKLTISKLSNYYITYLHSQNWK